MSHSRRGLVTLLHLLCLWQIILSIVLQHRYYMQFLMNFVNNLTKLLFANEKNRFNFMAYQTFSLILYSKLNMLNNYLLYYRFVHEIYLIYWTYSLITQKVLDMLINCIGNSRLEIQYKSISINSVSFIDKFQHHVT